MSYNAQFHNYSLNFSAHSTGSQRNFEDDSQRLRVNFQTLVEKILTRFRNRFSVNVQMKNQNLDLISASILNKVRHNSSVFVFVQGQSHKGP